MSDSPVRTVYHDGGLCGVAPTRWGGSWSFVFLDGQGAEVFRDSGAFRPSEFGMETVENNFTETYAIVRALEALPVGWVGNCYGDNLNSIRRARDPYWAKMGGVPPGVVMRLKDARADRPGVTFHLLGGHPTKAELAAGRRRDGKPVSPWNVLCDRLCCEAAATLRG